MGRERRVGIAEKQTQGITGERATDSLGIRGVGVSDLDPAMEKQMRKYFPTLETQQQVCVPNPQGVPSGFWGIIGDGDLTYSVPIQLNIANRGKVKVRVGIQEFYGLKYSEIPVVLIRCTKNNTKLGFSTPAGDPICYTSCSQEGFKNAKKKTMVAGMHASPASFTSPSSSRKGRVGSSIFYLTPRLKFE